MSISSFFKIMVIASALCFTPSIFADEANVPDSQISADIKNKVNADESLAGTGIKVDIDTKDQVVNLSGVVNSDSEASTLVELAQSTVGVQDVNTSNLVVKESKQPIADMFITAKVKGKFIREEIFGSKDITPMSISVETNNGIVYLTGKAETREQIENAVKLARTVEGVKNVRYRVQLTKGEVVNLESVDE